MHACMHMLTPFWKIIICEIFVDNSDVVDDAFNEEKKGFLGFLFFGCRNVCMHVGKGMSERVRVHF